jgi:hypothetical protein
MCVGRNGVLGMGWRGIDDHNSTAESDRAGRVELLLHDVCSSTIAPASTGFDELWSCKSSHDARIGGGVSTFCTLCVPGATRLPNQRRNARKYTPARRYTLTLKAALNPIAPASRAAAEERVSQ